jgi:hypothetical protein
MNVGPARHPPSVKEGTCWKTRVVIEKVVLVRIHMIEMAHMLKVAAVVLLKGSRRAALLAVPVRACLAAGGSLTAGGSQRASSTGRCPTGRRSLCRHSIGRCPIGWCNDRGRLCGGWHNCRGSGATWSQDVRQRNRRESTNDGRDGRMADAGWDRAAMSRACGRYSCRLHCRWLPNSGSGSGNNDKGRRYTGRGSCNRDLRRSCRIGLAGNNNGAGSSGRISGISIDR